uniref:Microcin DNA binding protein n=4 Tax=Enterobacteriaceae TaxID=543 RepID=Q46969_ECOLX|nr:microcin DNA binding protein [Escherichia coli]
MSELTKEDEYGIISRTMMNIRSLRVFAREIDFEQLLEMQEKLNVVIEERREDAEREAAERAERERKRQELLQLIAGEGFSPEELLGLSEEAPKSRKKTLPKPRLNISLKKMVKRNTGLVVDVRQNQLLKHWQVVVLLMSFSSRNDSTALLFSGGLYPLKHTCQPILYKCYV